MSKKTFLVTVVLSVVVLFNSYDISPVMACNNDGTCNAGAGEDYINCPDDCPKPISKILDDATNWLLTVASIVSILVVVIGGILYVGSSGNPETAKTAKSVVSGGILGLIICGLAYSIIKVIDTVL